MEPIKKPDGTTPSERYLKMLCEKSFLSLWSYPNVYRDQGQKEGKGVGKEVCDLLVVFDGDVIIFSDKSCAFPETGDVKVDWARWRNRAIAKSVNQLYGAERWIREHPQRLFLDPACKQPFPIDLGSVRDLRFHRVVVALGAGDRCRSYHGGSGSLMYISGMEAREPNAPFVVWGCDQTKGLVHIFDDVSLSIVLKELDTTADFLSYLRFKETLFTPARKVISTGEEEMLAYYLRRHGERGPTGTFPDEGNTDLLLISEGLWTHLQADPVYSRWKDVSAPSYVWDKMIEAFSRSILDRTTLPSDDTVAEQERRVRALARPKRMVRRGLAVAFADLFRSFSPGRANFRSVIPDGQKDTGYILLLVPPRRDDEPEGSYRAARTRLLFSYCMVFSWKHSELRHVIGIATASREATVGSEEIAYIDRAEWSPQDDAEAERLQQEYGLTIGAVRSRITFSDFDGIAAAHPAAKQKARRKKLSRAERKAERAGRKGKR